VDGEELMLSPCLPDSHHVQSPEEIGEYKINGIHVQNIVPMREWNVSYNGEMK
jgi:hypothetical protein